MSEPWGYTCYACDQCGAAITSGFAHQEYDCLRQQIRQALEAVRRCQERLDLLLGPQPSGEGLASGYVKAGTKEES